jgi:glycine oxidase
VPTINIAGAGIIGLSCAWRLAQRGWTVTIFEAGEAAREASWAAAGMLAPGGEFFEDSEVARLSMKSLGMYPEFVRELAEASGESIDFRLSGAVEVAYSEYEAAELAARAALQADFGIRSEECLHDGRPARHYPDDALVDPRTVTRALLAACRKLAVTIRENEPISSIEPGRLDADAMLVAAGAWTTNLLAAFAPELPTITPVRGHLIAYRMRPGLLGPILRNAGTYLVQRRSGVLVAGTTVERVGFRRELDSVALEDLAQRAGRLFSPLSAVAPTERWNGFRPFVENEIPVVRQVPGSAVWVASGHYRNGILLAPETSARVAQMFSAA